MSRTNTAAYESIKASQIVFQNPDRSFPEPGAVLAIDNLRGATTWTRNVDVDSVAIAGPSSVGTLTYNNQLLVNGIPVGGGGGADVSGGSNIAVDLSGGLQIISLDVREDIDMSSNSIINCKTIELPRIPNTSSAKITFGSMTDNKYGIVSYEDSVNTLLITSDKNVEVSGSNGKMTVGSIGISGETYLGKPIIGVVKTGYSTKVSSMELNAANTLVVGATDISGVAPTLALVDNTGNGSIRYVNPNIQTSKSVQIYTQNPQVVLQDSTNNRAAAVSFAGGSETLNMSAKNVSMISNAMGSVTIDSYGKTTSITGARISDSIYSAGGTPLSAAILTPNNTFSVGSVDISSNPVIVLQGGKDPVLVNKKKARIELFDASGELRISAEHYALNAVPSGSYPNVLGYDVATGAVRYQPAAGGGTDLSGGYNIAVGGGAINMNITQPVLMNNNPIVNASYVDLSSNGSSERISYTTADNTFISTANMTIKGPINPKVVLFNTNTQNYGTIQYENNLEKCSINGPNVALISEYGSQEITNAGPTMTSYNNRIYWNVYDPPNLILKSSLTLSTDNELQIGSFDVSANPVLIFQGGKEIDTQFDTSAKIEYFDASGIEQLRLTSKNYALNAVPVAGTALPNVLGYDTATGEIKSQPATNGISALSTYTYDASGLLNVSGGTNIGTFTPPTTGIYGINFIIKISSSSSNPIIFNNTTDAFNFNITHVPTILDNIKITSIQNKSGNSPIADLYSTSLYRLFTGGTPYLLTVLNDNASGTCSWASCIAEVRIVKLC